MLSDLSTLVSDVSATGDFVQLQSTFYSHYSRLSIYEGVISRNKVYLFFVCGQIDIRSRKASLPHVSCLHVYVFDCFNLRLKLQPLNLWFGMPLLSISSWLFCLTFIEINFNTNETNVCVCVCVNNYSNVKTNW